MRQHSQLRDKKARPWSPGDKTAAVRTGRWRSLELDTQCNPSRFLPNSVLSPVGTTFAPHFTEALRKRHLPPTAAPNHTKTSQRGEARQDTYRTTCYKYVEPQKDSRERYCVDAGSPALSLEGCSGFPE